MSADLDAIALRETLLTADGKGKAAKEHALQTLLNAACAEAIAQDRKARALTSGEAVEAAEIIDQLVFAAENADQDGYVTDVGFINVDELHAKARDMAEKLRAPSRTEREDTAPEVGGKENK